MGDTVILWLRAAPDSAADWLDFEFPRSDIDRFTPRPTTWLHYISESIYGAIGSIYTSRDSSLGVDRNEGSGRKEYFFRSSLEPRFVDYRASDTRSSISSSSSHAPNTRFLRLATVTRNRDGGRCIVSNDEAVWDVLHFIPQSRGSAYMTALYNFRSPTAPNKSPEGADPIEDIDDPRNCMLLDVGLHKRFGHYQAAFLRIPNRRMTLADVHLRPSLTSHARQLESCSSEHLVFQKLVAEPNFFLDICNRTCTYLAPDPNSREKAHSLAPNHVLLDVAYASAILHQYGQRHRAFFERHNERDYDERIKELRLAQGINTVTVPSENEDGGSRQLSCSPPHSEGQLPAGQCTGRVPLIKFKQMARQLSSEGSGGMSSSRSRVEEWLKRTRASDG